MKTFNCCIVAALMCLTLMNPHGVRADEAEDQYAFAAGLYKEKLYSEAADEFTKFLTQFPKHAKVPNAMFAIGQCQQLLKQFDKAAQTYERLATVYPTFEFVPQARLQQGECFLNLKQFDKARLAFQGAAKSSDEKIKAQAVYWVGECYYTQNDFANAVKFYQQVSPQSEMAAYAFYSIGLCQLKLNNAPAAAQAFQKVFTAYPQSDVAAECRYRFAESLYAQKKYAEAKPEYQAVVTRYANSDFEGLAWLGLGYCAFQQKDYAPAATAFEKAATKIPPENELRSEAFLRLGDCYYNLKQFDRAVDFYNQIVQDPKSPVRDQAIYWMANARREQKNLDNALFLYQSFVRQFPQSPLVVRAYVRMGDILADQKKYAEAVEAYKQAQALKPPADLAKEAEEGINYAVLQQAAAGGADAEKAAEQLKGEAAAKIYVQIGGAAFQQKNYAKSAQMFEKALANAPRGELEERALYGLAAAQLQDKKLTQAIANYRKHLTAHPNGKLAVNARVDLAWALLNNDQEEQVETVLQPLLTNRPTDKALAASAIHAAAEAAARQGKFDRAAPLFEELATKFADNADTLIAALFGWGSALLEQKKYPQAVVTLRQLIDRNPPADIAPVAWLRYGIALTKQEQKEDALKAFQKVLSDFPKSEFADRALYEIGWIYLDQKKSDDAFKAFQTLAAQFPRSPFADEARFHVGDYYFDKKDYAKAADNYKQVTGNELMDKSLYKLGSALYQQKDYAGAAQAFQQVVTKFPQSEVAAESQYWLGDALERTNKLDEAKAAYTAFTQKFSMNSFAPRAWLGLGRVQVAQKNVAAAKASLQKVGDKADGIVLAEMTKLLADVAFAQKEFKDALQNYLKVNIVYSDSPFTAEATFQIGQCHEQLGDKDKAKEAYQRVIDQFASSPFAAKAKERLQTL
jgi:tol-pal system protein YbgF